MQFPLPLEYRDRLAPGFVDILDEILGSGVTQSHPYIVHMMGIPGAGKSTVATLITHAMAQVMARVPVRIEFDAIMQAYGGYLAEANPVTALAKYELPARETGYVAIGQLLQRRVDVLWDHGGAAQDHPKILAYARSLGYAVYVVGVSVQRSVALQRIKERADRERRFTPPHYIEEREALLVALRPQYLDVASRFFEVPNNSPHDLAKIADIEAPRIVRLIKRDIETREGA